MNHTKPRKIQGLRTCVPSTGVFACIEGGERKNGDSGGKMVNLEKVRCGSNARRKRWKACKYLGSEEC